MVPRKSSAAVLALVAGTASGTNLRQASTTVHRPNHKPMYATSAAPPTRHGRLLHDSDDSSDSNADMGGSSSYNYVGCFNNDPELSLLEFGFISEDTTTERCYVFCTDKGATFMGLEYGIQCSCGFGEQGLYTGLGEGQCGYECYGDGSENCGGRHAFDLYSLGGDNAPDAGSPTMSPSPAALSTGSPIAPVSPLTPAPATAEPATPPTSGGAMMCSNGIPGIESLGGEVCCPAGCSQCGGSGCATAGLPDLGADECCAVEIFVSGWVCSITTVAPCIIDGPITTPSDDSSFSYSYSFDMEDDDFFGPIPTNAPVTAEPTPATTPMPVPVPPVSTVGPVTAATPTPVTPASPEPVTVPTPAPAMPATPKPVTAPTPAPVAPPTPEPVAAPTPKPVPAPTPTPGSPTPADMVELLDLHNEARCIHNADPLTWSSAVASSAAVHAETLMGSCGELFHSTREGRNGYGENLHMCWGTDSCYSAEKAMVGLYKEEIQVDSVAKYGGHATQILWKSTEELGCVVSKCSSGGTPYTYLVCQYNPPGNNMAQLEGEVEPPSGDGSC